MSLTHDLGRGYRYFQGTPLIAY
eukprot:COSAG02_NODE_39305_length_418_cov_1.614420_1_plen_22_part_01